MTGQPKQDYIDTIKNIWTDKAATNYIRKLEYAVAQIDEYISKLPVILESAIEQDYEQFQGFQKTNANKFN